MLELYLNEIYLGLGSPTAWRRRREAYFNKPLDELTLAGGRLPRCATQGARTTTTRSASPKPRAARRDWVIDRMVDDRRHHRPRARRRRQKADADPAGRRGQPPADGAGRRVVRRGGAAASSMIDRFGAEPGRSSQGGLMPCSTSLDPRCRHAADRGAAQGPDDLRPQRMAAGAGRSLELDGRGPKLTQGLGSAAGRHAAAAAACCRSGGCPRRGRSIAATTQAQARLGRAICRGSPAAGRSHRCEEGVVHCQDAAGWAQRPVRRQERPRATMGYADSAWRHRGRGSAACAWPTSPVPGDVVMVEPEPGPVARRARISSCVRSRRRQGALVSLDPANRPRAGDVRRLERGEAQPVQPRHPGAAPARQRRSSRSSISRRWSAASRPPSSSSMRPFCDGELAAEQLRDGLQRPDARCTTRCASSRSTW